MTVINWSPQLCRSILAKHPAEEGECVTCTKRGVGSNGGKVSAPCDPHRTAKARLEELGVPAEISP